MDTTYLSNGENFGNREKCKDANQSVIVDLV